jgi:hypothetical protein
VFRHLINQGDAAVESAPDSLIHGREFLLHQGTDALERFAATGIAAQHPVSPRECVV